MAREMLVLSIATMVLLSSISLFIGKGTQRTDILGLNETLWPSFRGGPNHNGTSPVDTSLNNGKVVMKFNTTAPIYSSPAVASDGTVYIGSLDGNLYALFPNGTMSWSFKTEDSIYSSPAIGPDGTVFIGSMDGSLYAIDHKGTMLWEYSTGGPIRSSPAIDDKGIVYVGSRDDRLHSIGPDGKRRWSYPTEGDVDSTPAIGPDGSIYFGSDDHYLYSIDIDGNLNWRLVTGSWVFSSPSIGLDGTAYVGSDDNELYAVHPNGSVRWTFNAQNDIYSSPAIVSDGTIYIGSDDDQLHALYPNGSEKWRFQTGDDVLSSPAVGSDGRTFFGSRDGNVYCLGNSGSLEWEVALGGPIASSSPGIGLNGTIYIGSIDGYLYGIGRDEGPPVCGKDSSDITATTGDPFRFEVNVTDDNPIEGVSVFVELWYGLSDHTTLPMVRSGTRFSCSTIIPSDSVEWLRYRFHTCDLADQWSVLPALGDSLFRPVTDNDGPSFVDESPLSGTTDDPFDLKVNCTDNIGIGEVAVQWEHGIKGGYWDKLSKVADGSFGLKLGLDRIDSALGYRLRAKDLAGNVLIGEQRSVTVIDNDPPLIEDRTRSTATTGGELVFEVMVRDNVGVKEVGIEHWFYGGGHVNTSLTGDIVRTAVLAVPGEEVGPLFYLIRAEDEAGNNDTTLVRKIEIDDDDGPELVKDGSDTKATTGDPFTFRFLVRDNISLESVSVEYWLSSGGHGNRSLVQGSELTRTIDIPSNATGTLSYKLSASDGSGNWFNAPLRVVPVIDNDPPEMLEDSTPDVTTTGDYLTFNITIQDNIHIAWVKMGLWQGDLSLPCPNLTCGVSYTVSVRTPDRSLQPLRYIFAYGDKAGNNGSSPERTIEVLDDDAPFIGGLSFPVSVESGSDLILSIDVMDNIDVSEVRLVYWFDDKVMLQTSMEGNGTYSATVPIPLGTEGGVHFLIRAFDGSRNTNSTHERSVPIRVPNEDGQRDMTLLFVAGCVLIVMIITSAILFFLIRNRRKGRGERSTGLVPGPEREVFE